MNKTSPFLMLVFVLIGAFTWACGDGSPTAPTVANVTGTWVGTPTWFGQSSQLRLTFSQNDRAEIAGTWMWAVDGESAGGPLAGRIDQSAVSVSLGPTNPADQCRVTITATVSGSRMTGTYGSFTCPSSFGGSVELTRQ